MHALLVVLTSLGLFAVGLCFIILLPNVGALLATLFSIFAGEQAASKLQGKKPGSEFIDPNILNGKESIE